MTVRGKACTALSAVLVSMLLLVSCSGGQAGDTGREGASTHWKEGGGAGEAAAFMKVRVPEGATEVKGAVRVNPREDEYILSFRTDGDTAARVAEDLRSEEPPAPWGVVSAQEPELFGHLGLPEPKTLEDALWAGVCPPCVKDHRRRDVAWMEIYVEDLGAGRARVYLRAF
ncbi:hypothetical protein [Streptomyces cinereoruber]|uniref:hypothetical protein n=2 Tax=Streptomyces cinereoruber TaxID=67260 RepID=UPI00362FA01D